MARDAPAASTRSPSASSAYGPSRADGRDTALEFPRFRGHLIAGPSGPAARIGVHAFDAAVFVGVPPRGGPAAEDERPLDPAAFARAGVLAAVVAQLVSSGRRGRGEGRGVDLG